MDVLLSIEFWMRVVLRKCEINAAVFWAVLTRVWQVLAGFMSFAILASCLAPDERGYYMTMWSVVAIQSMVDLGFSIVIVNFSSHEWASLSLTDDGRIEGDEESLSRLVSLGRAAAVWFTVAAAVFVVIAGTAGMLLFSARQNDQIEWLWPWWVTIACATGSVWCLPFLSLLEGCGQIERVYRFRLSQAVITNVFVWSCLLVGGGLWTVAVSAGIRFALELGFLTFGFRKFFAPFWRSPGCGRLSWRDDLWPVQWRLSVGGFFSYFACFLFNPVMFYYHSEELAGQMGMTRQLLMTIQAAAQSWVVVRVPEFGVLIARQEFETLDRKFFKLTALSTAALVVAGACFLLGIPVLQSFAPRFSESLLGFGPSLVMLVAMLCYQLPFAQTLYLRAHKREPLFFATALSNMSIGVAVWLLGWSFGAIGASTGYLVVVCLVTVPGIHSVWSRCRLEWHSKSTEEPTTTKSKS